MKIQVLLLPFCLLISTTLTAQSLGVCLKKQSYPANSNATPIDQKGLATADLTGDGLPEIISGGYSGMIDVYINLGNGTYSNPTSYTFTGEPHGIECADFDGDHDNDVAIAGFNNVISV